MSKVINTYKVTAELTVQAETEEQARVTIADLLNSPRITNPQTGGFSATDIRVAGVNNIKIEMVTESSQAKANKEATSKDNKLAQDEVKKLEKEGSITKESEVPDEVVVIDPETGTSKLVKNPMKEEMQKKQEENKNKTAKEVQEEREKGEREQQKQAEKAESQSNKSTTTAAGRR